MKLRVVDMGIWINSTNDDPQGNHYFDVPGDWDGLDEVQRIEWVDAQVASLDPPPARGTVNEFGDFQGDEWVAVGG